MTEREKEEKLAQWHEEQLLKDIRYARSVSGKVVKVGFVRCSYEEGLNFLRALKGINNEQSNLEK